MIIIDSLNECVKYLKGQLNIIVSLPAKKPTCQYCEFIGFHQSYDRHYCRLTYEYLLDYKHNRGEECPVKWKEKDDG